jgi:hypothetical protein
MKFAHLATAALTFCSVAATAAPVLMITPSVTSAGFGQVVTVNVGVSGLSASPVEQIVSAFDLNVLYNSLLLTQNGLAVFQAEALMGGPNVVFFDTMGTAAGDAAANAFSLADDVDLNALQGDFFTLFTLEFTTGSTNGAAFLNFGPDINFQRNVVGLGGQSLGASFGSACIAIGTGSCTQGVPEPSTYGLVGLALFAAYAVRRRAA